MAVEKEQSLLVCMIFLPIIAIYCFPLVHYAIERIYNCYRSDPKAQKLENTTEPAEPNPDGQLENVSELYDKEVFEKDVSLRRIYSMHFNVWVWIWIIYFAASSGSEDFKLNYPGTRKICNIYGYVHLPLLTLYMCIETFFCWEWKYLGNIMEEKTCRTYIKELIEARPIVIAKAVAWHFETRTRTVPYQIGGNTYYRTETYQERVVDYEEARDFIFSKWEDLSKNPDTLKLDDAKLTRIVMLKTVHLGDEETLIKFNQLVSEVENSVRSMSPGSHIDSVKEDGIPGFKDRLLAYWETRQPRWWIKRYVFVVASFLLLSWVYRIVFTLVSQKAHLRIVKKVYV